MAKAAADRKTFYAKHDSLLNPGERPPGTHGQPVQFPRWAPP